MSDFSQGLKINDDLVPLGESEFRYIADLLYDRFGIYLSDQKKVLVAGRLSKRLRQLHFESFKPYIDYLIADTSGTELSELINRITTNHTFFFREKEHFDFLSNTILPGLESAISKNPSYPLRIWSAGCATGEEVFSIAMQLHDYFGPRIARIDAALLATDISLAALQGASTGEYNASRLAEMPAKHKSAFFTKTGEDSWMICDELKKMVMFKRLNLMADSYPMRNQFDVIFCRNVMIYFDQESRTKVVNTLHKYIKPGGYLFIGHSESLKREESPFAYIKPAIYKKGER